MLINKTLKHQGEELTKTIMESFNDQQIFNVDFKKRVNKTLANLEGEYLNGSEDLKIILDSYIDNTNRLSENNMIKTLNLLEVFNKSFIDKNNVFSKSIVKIESNQWMKNWLDEMNLFRIENEVLTTVNLEEELCLYVGVVEEFQFFNL